MRVVFDQYAKVESSLRLRSGLMLLAAAVASLAAVIWLGLAMQGAFTVATSMSDRSGFLLVGALGFVPLSGAAWLLVSALFQRRRLARFRQLATLVKESPDRSVDDIARHIGLESMAVRELLLDARGAGVIAESHPAPGGALAQQLGVAETDAAVPPPAWRGAGSDAAQATMPERMSVGAHRLSGGTEKHGQEQSAAVMALQSSLSGALLNRTYQIEETLGSGAMGVVYGARQVRTGRRCAIKALLPDARLTPEALKRFEREAGALGSLGHPGIVDVQDFDVTPEGIHYLVMELLEGETLEARLGWRGGLPWNEARPIALALGAALAAAHRAGILHRDLKPSNVFLAAPSASEAERVVLVDFGLAKPKDSGAASRVTRPEEVVGTPMYLSPEQARGEALDERSDVYGLGAVVYEMVTGAPPFIDSTLAALYARVLAEAPPAASEVAVEIIPKALDELLARALAKERDDRYASVEAFLAAVEACPM